MIGFSRGSYTARALAGMLGMVGLLHKDNEEQVGTRFCRKLLLAIMSISLNSFSRSSLPMRYT
jgi:hypothetical protein